MEALAVHPHVQHHDDVLDDLPEGQGDDGEIIALQAQHGHAHNHAPRRPEHRAHRHGQGKAQGGEGDRLRQQEGGHHPGEGPQAHKARVAQGQLP